MRRLKLIFASISLLAMVSCCNDDKGYNWIYGTWQAVEFTMCNIEGDTESIDLREISDHILGTISFSHDGVATVRVVYFESKQKRLASEDYEVADEKVFEYQYTINDKYIPIYLLKMEIFAKKHDIDNVFIYAKKVIELDKDCPKAYFMLGNFYFERADKRFQTLV